MSKTVVSIEERFVVVFSKYLELATSLDDCISVYRKAPGGSDLETKALNKAYSLVVL